MKYMANVNSHTRLYVCVKSSACVAIGAVLLLNSSASAKQYNPGSLGAPALQRVRSICQNVMGLNPREPSSNVWGSSQDPALDPGENNFEGCVASLSDVVRTMDSADVTARAGADCRGRGLAVGTPALAECVWSARNQVAAGGDPVGGPLPAPRARGSFYAASTPEIGRREQEACVELGLVPGTASHEACVAHISDIFYRIQSNLYN
jgi:hypothetical protein